MKTENKRDGIITSDLITEYVAPVRVVAASENVGRADCLLTNRRTQVYLREENYTTCRGKGYIVLDFGREYHGGVRIITYHCGPRNEGTVRLRFGESVSESCAELGEKNATNHHAIRDMVVQIPNLSDQVFGRTGFRFLRIDFTEEDEIYQILNVYAATTRLPDKGDGDFECDDEEINEIYNVARYTLYLNMQDNLYEGIKRDRLVWVGDMQPEVLAITYMYGEHPLVEKAIRESIEQNPLPCWFGKIACYSGWLIQIVYDYYLKVKNTDFVLSAMPYLEGVLRQIGECVGSDGSIDFSRCAAQGRETVFFDWPTNGDSDALEGNRFVFIKAAESMRKLYSALGRQEDPLCGELLNRLRACRQTTVKAKQVAALGYLTGRIGKKDASAILTAGGVRGFSTFMSYFIFKALAESVGTTEALKSLREYYGGMLSRGATSFWEDFDVEWLDGSGRIDEFPKDGEKDLHGDHGAYCYKGFRHSLCHGWSCGPVQFLSENVLGINVLEAGCKTIEITPDLGDLKWCKGVFPTPFGNVTVSHKKLGEKIVSDISAPKEIKVIVKNEGGQRKRKEES